MFIWRWVYIIIICLQQQDFGTNSKLIKPLSLFCVFIKVYLWMHKRAQEFNSCHVSPISVAPTISTGWFFFFNFYPELFYAQKKQQIFSSQHYLQFLILTEIQTLFVIIFLIFKSKLPDNMIIRIFILFVYINYLPCHQS